MPLCHTQRAVSGNGLSCTGTVLLPWHATSSPLSTCIAGMHTVKHFASQSGKPNLTQGSPYPTPSKHTTPDTPSIAPVATTALHTTSRQNQARQRPRTFNPSPYPTRPCMPGAWTPRPAPSSAIAQRDTRGDTPPRKLLRSRVPAGCSTAFSNEPPPPRSSLKQHAAKQTGSPHRT